MLPARSVSGCNDLKGSFDPEGEVGRPIKRRDLEDEHALHYHDVVRREGDQFGALAGNLVTVRKPLQLAG